MLFLVQVYYTHPGFRTSIFGKNRAYCIRDFTVLVFVQHPNISKSCLCLSMSLQLHYTAQFVVNWPYMLLGALVFVLVFCHIFVILFVIVQERLGTAKWCTKSFKWNLIVMWWMTFLGYWYVQVLVKIWKIHWVHLNSKYRNTCLRWLHWQH